MGFLGAYVHILYWNISDFATYTCMYPAVKYHATAWFSDSDLGGAGGEHEPPAHGDVWATAFIEPLFAPNSPGSDLFALRDERALKRWRDRVR